MATTELTLELVMERQCMRLQLEQPIQDITAQEAIILSLNIGWTIIIRIIHITSICLRSQFQMGNKSRQEVRLVQ